METWKDVVGYEGRYIVSSLGRVSSLGNARRPNGCMLKPILRGGYRTVTLYDGSPGRTSGVKRNISHLVLTAFTGPKPSDKRDACHRDTNSLNDRKGNLYWGTRSENMADTVRSGSIVGENNYGCKLTFSDVTRIRSLAGRFTGIELAALFGVSNSSISGILSGKKRRFA